MAYGNWDKAAAKVASEHAAQELEQMIANATPEQLAFAGQIQTWLGKWYNGNSGEHPTGWKELAKQLASVNTGR